MSTSAGDRGRRLFFVPDEVCVVFEGTPPTGQEQDWYEGVAGRLNEEFARLAATSVPGTPGSQGVGKIERARRALADARQLTDDLRNYQKMEPRLFQELAAQTVGEGDAARVVQPWVVLPAKGGDTTRAVGPRTLGFYRVGPDQLGFGHGEPDPAELDRRNKRLTDLVNAARGLLPLTHGGGHIRAATPNWLCSAGQYVCPSPGAKPAPVPPREPRQGRWQFSFPNGEVEDLVGRQRGGESCPDVTVAILDTSPERGDVNGAAGRYPDNLQLRDLSAATNVRIDEEGAGGGLSWPQSYFDRLNGYVPNWRQFLDGQRGNHTADFFKMPDHGLFATGIVHDIAPQCAIHLIRVIGGYGVSDLRALVPTLKSLPEAFLKSDSQRLVVNLSLGFAIPPGEQLLREWLIEAYLAVEEDLGQSPDLESTLDALDAGASGNAQDQAVVRDLRDYLAYLHHSLHEIVKWINAEPHALIVAAAGNDNRFFPPIDPSLTGSTRPLRPEPRWPAQYDEALGVAAVGIEREAANFSNRGDIKRLGNGVATLGGNAALPQGNPSDPNTVTLGDIDTSPADPNDVDAVKGLYCSEKLCVSNADNQTGWVYWAGTSFSTPVISALAAALWCEHPDWGFDQVISYITTTLASPATNTTDPERLDCPTLDAYQRFITN
ncbi:MAG TPA: S8 family serine peptidase [Thermomicrobiales bacterium]|nr:S8 family serine peptidase [Thermomicrobiales bacterium]